MRFNSLELTPTGLYAPRLLPEEGEQTLAIVGFVSSHRLEHRAEGGYVSRKPSVRSA